MKAKISSIFNTPADRAWSAIVESKTLLFVTKGFLKFQWAETFPEKWVEGRTKKVGFCFLVLFQVGNINFILPKLVL